MTKKLFVLTIAFAFIASLLAVSPFFPSRAAHAAYHGTPLSHTRVHQVHGPLIDRVNCGNRTDFFTIWNYNYRGKLCFANGGEIFTHIYNVDRICTGNNSGHIWYIDYNKQPHQTDLAYNTCYRYNGRMYDLTHIIINYQ